jgi:hypothetical protein
LRWGGLLASAGLLCLGAGGCGAREGVSPGATVTVYVSAPLHGTGATRGQALCAGAKRELDAAEGRAGDVRVRAICLEDTGGANHWTLAAVGADARRAVEDSTAVGYIGESDPAAARFSETILEEAGIAQLPTSSGVAAMHRLLRAIGQADASSGSLRESVYDELR